MTCACAGRVTYGVPAPCPVHWPGHVVATIEAGAAKANAKESPMLSSEQFEAVKAVVEASRITGVSVGPLFTAGWSSALLHVLKQIESELVLKVEVSPTATATGTIEGLDGLGRRVGQG